MSDKAGWIKLYRDIQDNFLWEDKPFDKKSAWIDLLLSVNHADKKIMFNGSFVTVKKGQMITSIGKLANKWGWSKDKTRHYLLTLEADHMLTRNSDNIRTVLTVVNYGKYQNQSTTKPTTKPTAEQTTDPTTDPTQTRMIKNDKEVKEEPAALSSEQELEEMRKLGYE